MKPRFAAAVLLSFVALTPADAQEKPGGVCPVVYISCPEVPSPDKPVTYTATVKGGDPSVVPTFKWSVSSGRIISGQGTAEIRAEGGGSMQTATVEVGGYPSTCATENSCSWIVCTVVPRKVDEYGPKVSLGDEKARLANFARELQNEPASSGYIIAYAGRRARKGEARAAGERARGYLVNAWGIEASRVVAVDGGSRERRAVELFVVPPGAAPPDATPAVKPAVGRRGKNRR